MMERVEIRFTAIHTDSQGLRDEAVERLLERATARIVASALREYKFHTPVKIDEMPDSSIVVATWDELPETIRPNGGGR